MGLPLFETAQLLEAAGLRCWQRGDARPPRSPGGEPVK
jgi:hypothetical protein